MSFTFNRRLRLKRKATFKQSHLPLKKRPKLVQVESDTDSDWTSDSDESVDENEESLSFNLTNDLDNTLEEKSSLLNLTATNVKSILHVGILSYLQIHFTYSFSVNVLFHIEFNFRHP